MKNKKFLKSMLAVALALPLALTGVSPVEAAYTPSGTEIMFLAGLEATYNDPGKSYGLYDINMDSTVELFIGTEGKTGDTLDIFVFNEATRTPDLKKTIKKAVNVYDDYQHGQVIIETKGGGAVAYTTYKMNESGALKIKVSYTAKGGKYYKNKREISAAKFKKYKKKLEKNHTTIAFTPAASPWVDSSIPGVAEITGQPDLKDDFRLATTYSWLSEEHLADGKSRVSTLSSPAATLEENSEELLTDTNKYTGENIDIVRTYYDMATDWDKRDQDRVDPLRKYIDAIQNVNSLSEMTDLLLSDEICAFVNPAWLYVYYDKTDMTDWAGYIVPNDFSMSPYDYQEAMAQGLPLDDFRWEFGNLVRYALSRAGYPSRMIEETLSGCYEYENTIFEETQWDEDEKWMSYSACTSLCKNFPLEETMHSLGATKGKILVLFPSYLKALDNIYTEKNLPLIKAELIAMTSYQCLSLLDFEAAAIANGYLSYNGESIIEEETGKAAYTDDEIKEELNKLAKKSATSSNGLTHIAWEGAYMEAFGDPELKADLTRICEEEIATFEERIKKEDWLSAASKEAAIEKLHAMNFFILTSDDIIDASFLQMDPEMSYLEAYNQAFNADRKHLLSFVGEPIDHTRWNYDLIGSTTIMANAYYTQRLNIMTICLGIINDDTYRLDMSEEEKLSGLGYVIGHELTHGFDGDGCKYGKDGSLVVTEANPYGWFTESDFNAFYGKVGNVIDYFNAIWPTPESSCIGEALQGEAIADMGGVAVTLDISETIEDFDYDKYFRSLANFWKEQRTYESELNKLLTDEHPLNHLRVNVTLQQFDKFYETYGIKEGDGMYLAPEDRISVW